MGAQCCRNGAGLAGELGDEVSGGPSGAPWAWTSAPGEGEPRLIMGEHLVTFDPGLVLLDVIGR